MAVEDDAAWFARLEREERQAGVMRRAGVPVREIARATGLTPGQVYCRLKQYEKSVASELYEYELAMGCVAAAAEYMADCTQVKLRERIAELKEIAGM